MLLGERMRQIRQNILFINMMLIFLVLLSGCVGGENYKDYIDAANKTDDIEKGAQKIKVILNNTFNEDVLNNMSETDQEMLLALEQVEVSITSHFDYGLGQSLNSIYYLYKGLGTDIKVYQKSLGEMYLKLPFDGKLYQIDQESASSNDENMNFKGLFLSVGSDWHNMLKTENIFIGEKSIITSEAGDVKATKFTVKPTSAQLSEFMSLVRRNVLSNKEMLIEYINTSQKEQLMDQVTFEQFVNALFQSMSITRFEEVAYVDIDGYVIDEQIEIEIEYKTTNNFTNILKNQKITIMSSHWDIEKNQELDFSDLEHSEIVPIEQLSKGSVMP